MILSFEVPGDPVAWARPRKRKGGPRSGYYTQEKQANYGEVVAATALMVPRRQVLTGALFLDVIAHFQRGRSCKRKDDGHHDPAPHLHYGESSALIGTWWHPTNLHDDGDNIGKLIADSLKGVLIAEDGMIVDWRVRKVCGLLDPFVIVTVTSL